MGSDERFTHEAIESLDGKEVPLVMYTEDGTRKVVGTVTFKVDGKGLMIEGHTTDGDAAHVISVAANMFDSFAIADPKFEKEKEDGR